jgi:hypothetical protein
MAQDKRFTICSEYCGHAMPRPVIRFCGAFVASYPNYAAADAAMAELQAAAQWVLVRAHGDSVRLYAGDTGYRVAYGAHVRDFSDYAPAAREFESCKHHAIECEG